MSKSTTRTKKKAVAKKGMPIYVIQERSKSTSTGRPAGWSPGDNIYLYKADAAEDCRRYSVSGYFEYRVVKYLPEEEL